MSQSVAIRNENIFRIKIIYLSLEKEMRRVFKREEKERQ